MKKNQLVKQDNLKDCGVASLASIIKYYNGYVPTEKLREMTKTNKNGTTAYHIVEASKELGFNSYGIKCELENIDMDKITLPAIAYTIINNSYKHFVVIYDINFKTNKIIIADPMTKIKTMTISEFKKIYQNILIILYPIKNIPNYKLNNRFNQIIKSSFINKKVVFLIMISAIYLVLNLLCLIFLRNLFNNFKMSFIIVNFLLLFLLKIIVEFFRNKMLINFSFQTSLKLASEVFNQIIKLPYNFYRNRTTGDVISRFNDLEKIENNLLEIIINLFININLIIMSSLFIFFINKQILLIFIIIMILYLVLSLIFKNKIQNNLEQEKTYREKFNSDLIENISGFETIKGLNIEDNSINKLNKSYDNYLNKTKISDNNYNIFSCLKNSLASFSNILIITIGLTLVNKQIINISELLIINFLLPYFLEPINYIVDQIKTLKEIFISIRKINDLYYENNKEISNEEIKTIEFKNVDYKNNLEEYVLKNINLNINESDKMMIIGKSGSGKTTLLKLIKNYYDSNIYINNKQNKKYKKIIYVSQNEILFTDTLYNNITLGRNISNKYFKEIVKICHIDEIIKDKKLGYNLLLEENGFNISGGEKQRIILARTLLTDGDVFLFDESLSEVDTNLERLILKKIIKKFTNKTILLVSHRKDNLDLFNKLLLVTDKKIKVIERNDSNV